MSHCLTAHSTEWLLTRVLKEMYYFPLIRQPCGTKSGTCACDLFQIWIRDAAFILACVPAHQTKGLFKYAADLNQRWPWSSPLFFTWTSLPSGASHDAFSIDLPSVMMSSVEESTRSSGCSKVRKRVKEPWSKLWSSCHHSFISALLASNFQVLVCPLINQYVFLNGLLDLIHCVVVSVHL